MMEIIVRNTAKEGDYIIKSGKKQAVKSGTIIDWCLFHSL